MTKKLFALSLIFTLLATATFAQLMQPVSWTYKTKKVSANETDLIVSASILPTWHLYGQYFGDGGPLKTKFTFEKSKNYELVGKTKESPAPTKVHDEIFNMEVHYFSKSATFTQRIKVLTDRQFILVGSIEGQACLEDGQCVMVSDDFEFKVEGAEKVEVTQPTNTENTETPTTETDTIAAADSLPQIETAEVDTLALKNITETHPIVDNQNRIDLTNSSLLWLFWVSFLAGLLAILTPCVFPMIPMTVSFFMKDNQSKTKSKFQALFFGLSIILIYTVIGTIVAITLGANFANWLSTHWIPNVIFFLIFMFFAASFLGMFEIILPSWLVNKADQQVDKGGWLAPFFMAFTLVVVSFSCTGPLVGAILVKSAGGAVLEPIIGMLGFSLAFALPFTLFAFFPNWLSGMPKSGGWLNSVKVVLGFIELALGLKFLSVADQTYHWGLLDREIYLAFWIIIFTLMGLYLLGKLKFSHDSDLPYISVPRLMLAIVTFTFVIYLIPGMVGAPLKALAGYLPPQSSHDFDLHKIIRDYSGGGSHDESTSVCEKPKYGDILHLPHGLEGYFDYEQGMACAKKLNKPVFIDFTGHGCVNCREMEAVVWSDPKVLEKLRNEFVVIALYVDDKTELPESEWITSTYDGKVKKTIGKKYADFQISKFNVNAQPYYVLLDHNGEMLNEPRAYNKDIDAFVEFLEKGVEEFKKRQK